METTGATTHCSIEGDRELRSSIRQFVEMADQDDERRLKLDQMQLNIDKTKAEVKQITNESQSSSRTIIVNNKEEMRRLMNERANSERS